MANGKSTGRKARAYALTKEAALTGTSATMLKGIWYYVAAVDASASTIPTNVGVGRAFLCSKEATLGAADSLIPLSLSMYGFARDKSLDASKTVQDATTDIDEETDQISDGLVTKSGTINGYDLVDSPTATLKAQFQHTLVATASAGQADSIAKTEISTPKQLIMLDWTGGDVDEGDPIVVDIMPVIFTGMNKGASYGGVNTLNFNFSCVADDGAGCKPTHYEGFFRAVVAE